MRQTKDAFFRIIVNFYFHFLFFFYKYKLQIIVFRFDGACKNKREEKIIIIIKNRNAIRIALVFSYFRDIIFGSGAVMA